MPLIKDLSKNGGSNGRQSKLFSRAPFVECPEKVLMKVLPDFGVEANVDVKELTSRKCETFWIFFIIGSGYR